MLQEYVDRINIHSAKDINNFNLEITYRVFNGGECRIRTRETAHRGLHNFEFCKACFHFHRGMPAGLGINARETVDSIQKNFIKGYKNDKLKL